MEDGGEVSDTVSDRDCGKHAPGNFEKGVRNQNTDRLRKMIKKLRTELKNERAAHRTLKREYLSLLKKYKILRVERCKKTARLGADAAAQRIYRLEEAVFSIPEDMTEMIPTTNVRRLTHQGASGPTPMANQPSPNRDLNSVSDSSFNNLPRDIPSRPDTVFTTHPNSSTSYPGVVAMKVPSHLIQSGLFKSSNVEVLSESHHVAAMNISKETSAIFASDTSSASTNQLRHPEECTHFSPEANDLIHKLRYVTDPEERRNIVSRMKTMPEFQIYKRK